MRVLVTAGGTSERIDDVRGITNFSTGRLGSLIADAYAEKENSDVTYIHGKTAILPKNQNIKKIEIESVDDLLNSLETCLKQTNFDIVVHSMAVSDYYLAGTASQDQVVASLAKASQANLVATDIQLQEALETSFKNASESAGKMSSDLGTVYMQLKQTPKVIGRIKALQPATTLVGFKLLVDVPESELISVATRLMAKNSCDYVLANDKARISGDQHVGLLLTKEGTYTYFETKRDIAQGIVRETTQGRES